MQKISPQSVDLGTDWRNDMKELQKSIIKNFIIFAFAISIVESILDSCLNTLSKYIKDSSIFTIVLLLFIALSIGTFVLFSIWFAVIIKRKIEEETKRQMNERNILYANIVHDLKTPMTIILGFSQALQEKRLKEEEKEAVFHSIYEKAKKSDELLNILLHYTKLTTSDYQLHLEQQDICRIVRDTVALFYELFEDKQMEVTVEIPEKSIMKNLDQVEFTRAISNLLTNAIRHNENGCKVLIKLQEEYSKVIVTVADSGSSIPKELESTLFDPFVCTDESRNSRGGNGLGLAITNKIVEKHSGHVYIDSNIEGYTKGFVIEL